MGGRRREIRSRYNAISFLAFPSYLIISQIIIFLCSSPDSPWKKKWKILLFCCCSGLWVKFSSNKCGTFLSLGLSISIRYSIESTKLNVPFITWTCVWTFPKTAVDKWMKNNNQNIMIMANILKIYNSYFYSIYEIYIWNDDNAW